MSKYYRYFQGNYDKEFNIKNMRKYLDDKQELDKFLEEMRKLNIGVGVHYTALHLHPYYKKKYNYKIEERFKKAERIEKVLK